MSSFETKETFGLKPAIEMSSLGLTDEQIESLGGNVAVSGAAMIAFRQGLADRSALERKPGHTIDRQIDPNFFPYYQMGYETQGLLIKKEGSKL